jgi:hypothetical protein
MQLARMTGTNDPLRLDRALEAAVVAHWNDLMPDSVASGAMEIVYGTATDHTLDYFKVFSSETRGYWNLVCEYWLKPLWSHSVGLSFVSKTHSAEFAAALTLLVKREGVFVGLPSPDRSIQVPCPTHSERVSAKKFIEDVRTRFAEGRNSPTT